MDPELTDSHTERVKVDRVLKPSQISKLRLIPAGPLRVWQILKDPKNKFTLIRCGGTDKRPYFGVRESDIKRYYDEMK